MGELSTSPVPPDIMERRSVVFSQPSPGMVVQEGESGFKEELSRLYDPAESNAAEQLVDLKNALRIADTDSFWSLLTKGLARIADAQYAFVSKRILVDEKNVAVEMPPIGEPGSCLMGEAFYINDDKGNGPSHLRNFKYHAYQCPCAYMKHDKIFVIPERLNEFIVNNPNDLIIPGEAYLGIPLFAEGKCFAHFGVMWGKEGAARRTLSWGFLETLFHALEDMILERVLEGDNFAESAHVVRKEQPKVVPHMAISVAQSFKPYARSLSHELRTPMQGVVGMLDVMMANVKEASETMDIDVRTRKMLDTLKENIEAVQDSSRRAVEAADNVVYAYDMNMGVPEAPVSPLDKSPNQWNTFWREARPEFARPEYFGAANDINRQQRGVKRRREDNQWEENQTRVVRPIRRRTRDTFSEEPPVRGSISCPPQSSLRQIAKMERCQGRCSSSTSFPRFVTGHQKTPSLRHTNIREVLHYVITDALKVGGRPDSAIAEATDNGERIEVRTRNSNGEASTKWVEWSVSPDVPGSILIDEKDLAKVVSCVTLNAIKFTQNGSITLEATLSAKGRYVVINVKDTGSGIPAAFLPNLFKPFSREDDSTTRQSEGLGLGLMVAKGLARKLGGDLFCLRSHVSGSKKGSEFELRVPVTAGEVCSRPSSPFGSPTPSVQARMSVDPEIPHVDINREPITPPLSSGPFVGEPCQTPINDMDTPTVVVHTAPSSNVLGLLSPRRTSSPLRYPSKGLAKKAPVPKLAEELPLNILAVDDNAINRRVLQNMLNRLGYQNVETACNGIDAIEVMHRNSFAPASEAIDLVLMDLWMPHLDGFQAATSILRMPELINNGRMPTILAVTADVTDAALDKAASSGMKGYVTKPFVTRDLVRLIRTYCATRES
ncbi:putative histidine kinase HHK17p [Didymella exigua CBS 183.55]|uniref:histidine kinase n=1 Tax=Didymella exigua CBS 183.55 TaxID=1150837 RepID=A0A6A5RQP6_9PLEO|nr:putative histidine kinase HHK17p [Didymella exigua CBS 183.55]KAF1929650.1 putative histidine kinase HHK17p [Didymella exigua CBS 183.55]